MRNFIRYYFAGVFLILGCHSNENTFGHGAAGKRLQDLLDQKEYFRLNDQLNSLKPGLVNEERLYYQAFVDNAFNRNRQAIEDIVSLFKDYNAALPDSLKVNLYLLQSDSYFKIFQYAESAQSDSMALDRGAHNSDTAELNDIRNDLLVRNALRSISPQQSIIQDSTMIHWVKDRLGLIEIPLKCRGINYEAIFDTRANISSISRTFATRLGLKILPVTYEEGSGITGIKFQTGLGIADSLYIGNILIRNAVFQVMPDSILYLAQANFSLSIIIGFPIIEELREIHLHQDGRMVIPLKTSPSDLKNFALDGLDPVIMLRSDQDTLNFHIDLGATSTTLYDAYFEKYKRKIIKEGVKKSADFGGAGGVKRKDVYVLPGLHLTLGDQTVTVDSVDVLTQKIFPKERFYGNLGQDFTGKFREIIFNFNYMYIEVK